MNPDSIQTLPSFAAAEYIRQIGRGAKGARSLTQQDAYKVFSAMLSARVPDLELGALLLAWRIKGESVEELAGMLDAAHSTCQTLNFLQAPGHSACLPVIIPSYNGARKQPNLVPLLALLLARQGIPVLVHGIASFPNRVTSATLFEALGVAICSSVEQAQHQLTDARLAFVPIDILSPSIADLLGKRSSIGLRNSAHTIVKMLQPIGMHTEQEAVRLVNYTHPEYLHTLSEYFIKYPSNAVLARGTEGEAVADARRMSRMVWMANGQEQVMTEGSRTFTEIATELPDGLDIQATVDYVQGVLSGLYPVPLPIAEQVATIANIAFRKPALAIPASSKPA